MALTQAIAGQLFGNVIDNREAQGSPTPYSPVKLWAQLLSFSAVPLFLIISTR
jgi:hypothetical protein